MRKIAKKITAVVLLISLMLTATFIVSAEGTLEDLGYTVEIGSWSSTDALPKEIDRETKLTLVESFLLQYALKASQNIDFENYETVIYETESGDCVETKTIPLLFGYSIKLISIAYNPGGKPLQEMREQGTARGVIFKETFANIYDNYGQRIAYAQLYATFITSPTTVSLQNSGTYSLVGSGVPVSWAFSSIVNSSSTNTFSICSFVSMLVRPSLHSSIASIAISTSNISSSTFSDDPKALINTFFLG